MLRPVGRWQWYGHSAHLGQEVTVHYRWHGLYGRRLKVHGTKSSRAGAVVYVETAPGVVILIAAWMLDPLACAGMELGAPRVTVEALADLQRLLRAGGSRRSSPDDSNPGAACHEPFTPSDPDVAAVPATPRAAPVRAGVGGRPSGGLEPGAAGQGLPARDATFAASGRDRAGEPSR